jgi:hypothetical protein
MWTMSSPTRTSNTRVVINHFSSLLLTNTLYHDMISSVSLLVGYRITQLSGTTSQKEKRLFCVG